MSGKHLPFIGLCLGFFLVMMDTTSVPLVYTTLMSEFGVGPVAVAWVNNIYLIAFAASLLPGGRLGDSLDRKNVVLAALVLVGAGAVVSGTDRSLSLVIAGRAFMGVGAGLLMPQSMAYIAILFAQGGRGTALGIWAAIAGIATATGPVVAQGFVAAGDWRWVMWINAPIASCAFVAVLASLPSDPGHGLRRDEITSSAIVSLGLGAAILGLQIVADGDGTEIAGAALGLAGLAVLIVMAARDRTGRGAMLLSNRLWDDASFLRISLVSALLGMGLTAFYLPITFLMDVVLGLGPVETSAVMIAIALSNAFVGPFAGRLSDRLAPEIIVRTGLLLFGFANIALGLLGLVADPSHAMFPAALAIMVVAGTGTGLAFAPLANLALSRANRSDVGRAAAFFSTMRQTLSALGSVLVAFVFGWAIRLQIGGTMNPSVAALKGASHETALACFLAFCVIALCLSIGAILSRRARAPGEPAGVLSEH